MCKINNIDNADITATFTALPWRIASEGKAIQVARAVEAVFNVQAVAFNGGDGWYVLATSGAAFESDEGKERAGMLMELLGQFEVTPAEDYQVEPLPQMADEADEAGLPDDIVYRGEHAINLERQIASLSVKLDRIAAMIGPVDVWPEPAMRRGEEVLA